MAEETFFMCPKCGKTFQGNKDWGEHMKRKHPEVPFPFDPDLLESAERAYKKYAKKSIVSEKRLTSKEDEKEETEQEEAEKKGKSKEENPQYECPECGAKFPKPYSKCPECGSELQWERKQESE